MIALWVEVYVSQNSSYNKRPDLFGLLKKGLDYVDNYYIGFNNDFFLWRHEMEAPNLFESNVVSESINKVLD